MPTISSRHPQAAAHHLSYRFQGSRKNLKCKTLVGTALAEKRSDAVKLQLGTPWEVQ